MASTTQSTTTGVTLENSTTTTGIDATVTPPVLLDVTGTEEHVDDDIKLFVGQIPRIMNEEALHPIFSPFGTIVELSVIRNKTSGEHRGCAFVRFSNKSEAEAAIASLHNNRVLQPMNHPLQVKFANEQQDKLEHKLFVGMIPKTLSESEIGAIFAQFGQINEVFVLREPTGMSKGCAFVRMATRSAAEEAIRTLNGRKKIEGAPGPLAVRYADNNKERRQNAGAGMGMGVGMGTLGLTAMMRHPMHMGAMNPQQPYATSSGAGNPPDANPMGMGMGVGMGGNGMGMSTPGMGMGAGMGAAGMGMGAGMGMNMGMAGAPHWSPLAGMPTTSPQAEGPMGANLFIYHLPPEFADADLAVAFSTFGSVISSKVFIDKMTGQSKGFGFVSYDNPESAQNAIRAMDGFQIGTKRLKVQIKKPRGSPY